MNPRALADVASYFGVYDKHIGKCVEEVAKHISLSTEIILKTTHETVQGRLIAFVDDANRKIPAGVKKINPLDMHKIWNVTKITPQAMIDSSHGVDMVTTLWGQVHLERYSFESAERWIRELISNNPLGAEATTKYFKVRFVERAYVEETMKYFGEKLMNRLYPPKYTADRISSRLERIDEL